MKDTNASTGFPSHFVDPAIKKQKPWNLAYSKAFHEEAAEKPGNFALIRNSDKFKNNRRYSRGEQDPRQYKELIGLKRSQNKDPRTSFRNINFSILKVAPKIKNVLVNKVVNQPLYLKVDPIDPKSQNERQLYKARLTEFIVSQEYARQYEQLVGMGLEQPGEDPPTNLMEIDSYVDMNPKEIGSMEAYDWVYNNFYKKQWGNMQQELAGDFFDYGIAGTRTYLDVGNQVKSRRILIDQCICNNVIYPDFRDLIRFGEYRTITVSELKKETKGEWGESVYREIADKYAMGHQGKYKDTFNGAYFNSGTYSYAYDHEKVTVLDAVWLSVDTEVYEIFKNSSGGTRTKEQKYNYRPFLGDKSVNDGRGMSDEEYSKFTGGQKEIRRVERINVYQNTWLVGTEHCYNFGLMPNMLRRSSDWQDTKLPVTLISTDFMAPIEMIQEPLDQVQLNYLQYQSHVGSSKPPGIAIEKNALAKVGRGGQGGKKWDPKEALELYAETGNLVYDGYDQNGTPLQQPPFKELANGLSEGAPGHLELCWKWVDWIRFQIGIGPMTEGGNTPPERLNNDVAHMQFAANENALSHIIIAQKKLFEGTANNEYMMFQNSLHLRDNLDKEARELGQESAFYFDLNKEIPFRDMGIIIEEGPDDATKEWMRNTLQTMIAAGQISGADAMMVQRWPNYHRQIAYVRKMEREFIQRRDAAEMEKMRTQSEGNTQTALALEEEKRKTFELESQARINEKTLEYDFELRRDERKFAHEQRLKDKELDLKRSNNEDDNSALIESKRIEKQTQLEKQELANEKPKNKE